MDIVRSEYIGERLLQLIGDYNDDGSQEYDFYRVYVDGKLMDGPDFHEEPSYKETVAVAAANGIEEAQDLMLAEGWQLCRAPDCMRIATVEVILYDVYLYGRDADVFFEQDFTCPFLCSEHVLENEKKMQGTRAPRETTYYPFTNRHGAQGFTIYRPLDK